MNITDHSPVTVTVLLENKCPDQSLAVEHGLSFHIRTQSRQIVFDTGQSGVFVDNATRLGIDLDESTAVVLSHGHYDHTGGLDRLLSSGKTLEIYAHPDVVVERFSIKETGLTRSNGIPAESLRKLQKNGFHEVTRPILLTTHVYATGPVPRMTDYEDTGGPFFRDTDGKIPDLITDDQALCITNDRGLIIILGCAHAGIINTVRYCQEFTGTKKVHAIIGGFHLLNASDSRMQKTLDALKIIDADILAPCHCTGEKQTEQLKTAFPDSFQSCYCGSEFTFALA